MQDHLPNPSPPPIPQEAPIPTLAGLWKGSSVRYPGLQDSPGTGAFDCSLPSPTSDLEESSATPVIIKLKCSPWNMFKPAPAVDELDREGNACCPITGHSYQAVQPGGTGQVFADHSEDLF